MMDLFMSPECNWSFSYLASWLLACTSPGVCCLGFVIACAWAEKAYQNPVERRSFQDKNIQAMVVFICVMYVFVTAKTLEPVFCQSTTDGRRVMIYAQHIECQNLNQCYSALDCEYFWIFVSSLLFFLIYGVGIPLFLFIKLREANITNRMGDIRTMQRYGWLYMRYNRDQYYWEIVTMFRKLLLVIIKATCIHWPWGQAYLSISVLAVFFYLHAKNLPFMSF
eukprot:FR736652.1.p1 GENE.FR736652.1~~FR736652.1.p1  ORF type:complete len:261 (+),score=18.79 FR736652.1:117-785(+)